MPPTGMPQGQMMGPMGPMGQGPPAPLDPALLEQQALLALLTAPPPVGSAPQPYLPPTPSSGRRAW